MEKENLSSVNVHFSDDYGKFKFLRGNRDLNSAKINRITDSVHNGLNLFRYCPIMVNKEGYIIDGQHRFYVSKKLGLPVFYIIAPDFSLRQIAEMNQNASKWKDKDFVNCYIDTGNKHYNTLKDFVEKYQLNLGIAASLLSDGKVRGIKTIDVMRDGLFKAEKLNYATKFMEVAMQFKDYCESYRSRNFLQALEVLTASSDFTLTEFLDKLKLHGLKIENRQSHKEYLTHLEDLYNYRNSKRKRIY
jgi:hypothetical protein